MVAPGGLNGKKSHSLITLFKKLDNKRTQPLLKKSIIDILFNKFFDDSMLLFQKTRK